MLANIHYHCGGRFINYMCHIQINVFIYMSAFFTYFLSIEQGGRALFF